MQKVDRVFGWLLILGSCGHTAGTFLWVPFMSGMFVWSLGSSLAAALLGVLNLVRAGRPDDKTLAMITAIGSACWVLIAVAFGQSINNLLDPRALMHAITAAVLVGFSIRTLRNANLYAADTRRLPNAPVTDQGRSMIGHYN